MPERIKRRICIWDIIWAAVFICSFVFVWWKCRYGFGNVDESFYLTIPYRLCMGDGLLAQEWHLTQLSGFLLMPAMKAFLAINGSTDGIILAFRYLYVIVQASASVFLYIRLRKISRPGAAAASIVFMLFAPFGIMALSYNSMGMICMVVCLVIVMTAERIRPVQYMIAGIFFAGAVLCCPYLVFLYVIYLITVIIIAAVKRGKTESTGVFSFRSWLFFTAGTAVLFVVFAAFVLSRTGISDIIAVLPSIMNDGAHGTVGPVEFAVSYFRSILSLSVAADIGYALTTVITVAAAADRKRKGHSVVYFSAEAIVSAYTVLCMAFCEGFINYVMFPLNLMAIVCVIICSDEEMRRMLFVMWVPGVIYTFCVHAASNQLFYAISMASSVPLAASLVIICMCAQRLANGMQKRPSPGKIVPVVLCVILVLSQLVPEAYLRYSTVFWESMDILQKERQTEGTEAGLYISGETEKGYRMTLALRDYINEHYSESVNVIFISDYTWLYLLCSERGNASYSAWLFDLDGSIPEANMERLMRYYEVFPDKIPDLVYIEDQFAGHEKWFRPLADYTEDDRFEGGLILVRQ